MKILQVVHYFPPSDRGGAEVYTCHLSKEHLKFHDVRLFFTIPDDTGSGKIEQGSYDGIPYWALRKNYSTFDRPFHEQSRLVEQEFTKAIEAFKPDIIHFQHLINLSLTLPRIAKQRGIATCFTLHDFWLLCPRNFLLNQKLQLCPGYKAHRCTDCMSDRTGYYNSPTRGALPIRFFKQTAKRWVNYAKNRLLYFSLASWRPSLTKKIFQDIDLFIAPSRFLLEKFVSAGVPSEKIVFCRHGFDTQIFTHIKKTSSPVLRFAFIGSMHPHKGIDTLLAAFNLIAEPHELKIYGDISPAVRQDLQQKIQNPRIHLMGELKKEEKKVAFSKIDVLILPSLCYENCPLVIGEAFLTKTPVIVSDLGGMPELVQNGKTGFTFPAGNAPALAEKINMFIDNPRLIQSFAAQIPKIKDIETHAAEISDIYKEITGCRNERL